MNKQEYEELSREEFGFERGKFSQKCEKCEHINVVFTQMDDCPEYYTTVITKCRCDNNISWTLPVN